MFRTDVQQPVVRTSPACLPQRCDVAVLGGGMAGMATAARLQAAGLSTVVIEAHGHVGGCAGFYRRRGFAFDVGATTLVDFGPGGVGGELLDAIGAPPLTAGHLPGYRAWLPDRVVTLHRDQSAWHRERLRAFGDGPAHRGFWALLDRLATVFWAASRAGVRMPVRTPADALHDLRALGAWHLPLARYARWTVADALERHGLGGDVALTALLGMLIEDTVHSTVADAPLINAALGVTIRGAGLARHPGGMYGFWRDFLAHHRALGGRVVTGCAVRRVEGAAGAWRVHTSRGVLDAAQVVAALPAAGTARLAAGTPVAARLAPYLRRDAGSLGGAAVVFLGVPEHEVAGQDFTHHQVLDRYGAPLGDGNNMFVSVSEPGDTWSAPPGYRAVMISTHTALAGWAGLDDSAYSTRKERLGRRLVDLARRVHPRLGDQAVIRQVGTPRTYERFTGRPAGAVGGVRQTLSNTNQHAIPYDLGVPGFWLVGDSTWPGLGTVACVLGSRTVAAAVLAHRPAARAARRRR